MAGHTTDHAPVDGSPATVGPYRIKGVLGRGGMGVVYRAEHAATGAPVALKTVAHITPTRLAALRDEVRALRDIEHPGVVRVLDDGIARGVPWYAMELFENGTLRDELRTRDNNATDARADETATAVVSFVPRANTAGATAPLASAALEHVALLARLSETLAFLHSRGVVHRDLKPENVFVRADRSPVLADLGIAAHFPPAQARETLHGAEAAGSAAYMAPEQIRGELTDARTDLYALGCILYECVSGTTPFDGPDATAVLRGHLESRAEPLARRVRGVPPALDALVTRLLARRPEDRPSYAVDVAHALAAIARGDESGDTPAPPAPSHLHRPAFVGRAEPLERLRAAVERAARGERGGRIFLAGESGIGKTRLALELVRVATDHGLAVVLSACAAPSPGGDPLHVFAPLLLAVADRCRSTDAATTARILGDRAPLLAHYQPALAELSQSDLATPPPLPPAAARTRVLDAVVATTLAFARERPLLLVLDDLQWVDALSLDALSRLGASDAAAGGLLVLGTFRSEESSDALIALSRARGAEHIALRRLDAREIGPMAGSLLALATPPPALVDFLQRRCEGNPFFVAECVRALIAQRLLTRTRDGRWRLTPRGPKSTGLEGASPLPRVLSALIAQRLHALDPAARDVTQAAAVLGREFDVSLLAQTAGAAAMEALVVLRQRQIVEDVTPGRMRFVHDRIREVAYRRTPAATRRALHQHAARALESRSSVGAESSAWASLGYHWDRAGAPDRASEYLLRAGERARAVYANEDATALFEGAGRAARRAREATANDAARWRAIEARAHESLGDLHALRGAHARARAAYTRALAHGATSAPLDGARLHRKLGKTWETQHRHDHALAAFDRADAALGADPAARAPAAHRAWIETQLDRIAVHYWRAEVDRIAALANTLRPVVDAHGERPQRDRYFRTLIQLNLRAERYAASAATVGHARAYVAACEAASDEADAASARCGLGTVLLWHGDFDGADRALGDALATAERVGDAALRARCLCYLAFSQRRRGDVERTRVLAGRALAAAEAARMADYEGAARGNLAWVALRDEARTDAARLGRDALVLWRGLTLAFPFAWLARLPLMAVASHKGQGLALARHAATLLDPLQAALPAALTAALRRCAAAHGDDRIAAGRAAIALARRRGYL